MKKSTIFLKCNLSSLPLKTLILGAFTVSLSGLFQHSMTLYENKPSWNPSTSRFFQLYVLPVVPLKFIFIVIYNVNTYVNYL